MITNYEISGNDSLSRDGSEAVWGTFSIELCDGEDDRSRFLTNQRAAYLLYMWQNHNEYDLVSFACSHIPKIMTSNSLTSPSIASDDNNSRGSPKGYIINSQVQQVGKGVNVIVSMEIQR